MQNGRQNMCGIIVEAHQEDTPDQVNQNAWFWNYKYLTETHHLEKQAKSFK